MVEPSELIAQAEAYPGEDFESEDFEAVQNAVHDGGLGAVADTPSALILGSYDEEKKGRLEDVQEELSDHIESFIMEEIIEAWTYWTSKFKLLVSNSEIVVGVYEDSHGGHEWEAGYLDSGSTREQTIVLRRNYPDIDNPKDEPFDAMMAHWIESMRSLDQVYDWTLGDEGNLLLEEAVGRVVANHVY